MRVPGTITAYLELCRISNLPSIWTNVLAATLFATGKFESSVYFPLALSLSCFYLAGMALNDICDAQHDTRYRPTRPIPAGRVSKQSAERATLGLFAAGFLLLIPMPDAKGFFAALALLASIVLYDLHHKNNPFSVLLMAACRFLVYAVTGYAILGGMSTMTMIAGAVQFCYVVAISIIARYENSRPAPFTWPVIPLLLSGICIIDGILLATSIAPAWLAVGIGGAILMLAGQKYFRGN